MHIVGLDEYEDLVKSLRGLPHRATAAQAIHERRDAVVSRSDPGAAGQSDGVHVAADDVQSLGQSARTGTRRATIGSKSNSRSGKNSRRILDEDNILSTDSTTPLDIERHDKNMYCGDWMVGEYSGDQALENRPFPGWGQYRTPIDGLFMCGSSCHPGGNITGAPGYNAAKVIAESLGTQDMVESGGLPRTSEGTDMKNWSDGIMEWWSDGSGTQYSSTPTLHHSRGRL